MKIKHQPLMECLQYEVNQCNDNEIELKNLKAILSYYVETINDRIKSNQSSFIINNSVSASMNFNGINNNGSNHNSNIAVKKNSDLSLPLS